MFDWFLASAGTGSAGLEKMRTDFGQMLDAGRQIFETAANALLGGTDPDVIRDGLFEADRRINRAEQQIRRELIVHASVHGATEFPACLVLMSVVKDAERVGDYAKNLFELAEAVPQRPGARSPLVRRVPAALGAFRPGHFALSKRERAINASAHPAEVP